MHWHFIAIFDIKITEYSHRTIVVIPLLFKRTVTIHIEYVLLCSIRIL